MLEMYSEITHDKKNILLEKLFEVKNFCIKNELDYSKFEKISQKISEDKFVITVLGEFNRGKSTLINSLIGIPLLPIGITPTTATINVLYYNDTVKTSIKYLDGSIVESGESNISDFFSKLQPEKIKEIRIGYPSEILKGLEIVDTPGVNDLNEQKLEITYGFIPESDAVIFVLDCEQLLSKSEADFLSFRLLSNDINKLIFVANKSDQLSLDELTSVIEYAKGKLSNFVNNPVIIPYSSKLALNAKIKNENPDGSNYYNFVETIKQNLISKKEEIIFENSYRLVFNLILKLIGDFKLKKQISQKSIEEIEENIALINNNENSLNKKLEDIINFTKTEVNNLKKKQIAKLGTFAVEMNEGVINEIKEIPYEDLKKYFPHFVHDKFKEWLELHETQINIAIIEIFETALKDLKNVFSELKNELSLNINFSNILFKDSAKTYLTDVGTTAVMSTGVFFATSFGGLFPLIAGSLLLIGGGFLSLMLKENREKAYKEDFENLAQNCIIKTSAKISPKLEELILGTASKFEEQIREYFDNELNSIKEMLNSSIAERAEKSVSLNQKSEKYDENISCLENMITELK